MGGALPFAALYGRLPSMPKVKLDEVEERTRVNLSLLAGMWGLTDDALAKETNMSRSQIQQRRNGDARIRPSQTREFAAALGVPVDVLEGTAADMLRWTAEHESDLTVRFARIAA